MDDDPTRVFGPFYGARTGALQCDVLAIARIGPKLLAKEAALYRHKWFDYRPLHPTLATYLFAAHFNAAAGRFMVTNLSRERGHVGSFKGDDVMALRETASYWRLRQQVDALGMRYDFFLRHALGWYAQAGWKRVPRPGQIGANADLMVDAANAWERECRAKISWATHRRYTASRFVGAPDQLAYEEGLVARILQKAQPHYALHAALYLHDALRIETAIARLPLPTVAAAIDHAKLVN